MTDGVGRLDLSVVIVSWNTEGLLRDCLRSLFDGGGIGPLRAEVWVVDNASSDGSPAMVREEFPAVRLVENAENVGFARANNEALRQAAGTYHLLLNSDTVVPPGALAALVAVMDARPGAAVCSPLLLNGDGSPQWCWARFPNLRSEITGELDRSQSPYLLGDYADPARRAAMRPFPVDWVGGACFLVRAEATARVGLLDERFFMYSEETDWCRRLREAGYECLLAPAVAVTHLGGQSSRAVPLATRRRLYRSSLRFYRLHYGPVGALPPAAVATLRYALFRLRQGRHRGGDRRQRTAA